MGVKRFGRVRQLPSGNYQASFAAPSRGRVTAPVTFSSAEDAEVWLATQRADLVRKSWKAPEIGRQSLSVFATAWLKDRQDLKPRTAALYAGLLTRHILPGLGSLSLRDITQAEVRRWYSELAYSTGPTAQAQSYRVLRTILGQAVREGEIGANPCVIRRAGIVEAQERQAPTLAQIHALAEAVPSRYGAMVHVAAYGGLRFGELTALTRGDLTFTKQGIPQVRVRRAMHRLSGQWLTGTPKSAAGVRTVALPVFLGPVLEAHLGLYVPEASDSLIFGTRSGKPLSAANFGKMWRRVRGGVGLPDAHFHDLRHAAATLAVQSGATLKDTMARLGHSTPRAALIYQHSASDRDIAIAKALDKAREAQLAEPKPQHGRYDSSTGPSHVARGSSRRRR